MHVISRAGRQIQRRNFRLYFVYLLYNGNSIRACFTVLEADLLRLRCIQLEVGHKQLTCNATDFATYSTAIIVDQYNRVLERIIVKAPTVTFRAFDLTFNVNYTIKFGTGEQKICLFGMFTK